jgi:hypothetical protein
VLGRAHAHTGAAWLDGGTVGRGRGGIGAAWRHDEHDPGSGYGVRPEAHSGLLVKEAGPQLGQVGCAVGKRVGRSAGLAGPGAGVGPRENKAR